MKKRTDTLAAVLLALALAASLSACGNSASGAPKQEQKSVVAAESAAQTSEALSETVSEVSEQDAVSWKDNFTEENGIYTAVVTSGTPVAGGGLVVEVDPGEETVKFTICDTEGNRTVEYLQLNFATQMLERYQYVSAMGQGFYYYADLDGSNLSVFNTEGEDRTEGAKESNHYQPAVDATNDMLDSYTAWFETEFGVPASAAAEAE